MAEPPSPASPQKRKLLDLPAEILVPDAGAPLLGGEAHAHGSSSGALQGTNTPTSPTTPGGSSIRSRVRALPIAAVAYIPIGLLWLFGVSAATIVFNIITLCRCRELAMDIFAPLLARGLLWILGIRVRVRGTEYLPTRGGPTGPSALKSTQVIICNHTSFLDAMAICAVCPHAMYYVAKKEIVYFPVLGWAWWILAQGMISRSNKTAARSTMDTLRDDCIAADAKRRPRQVIFFPEGTRSPTGRLQPFKKGAFHLAQQLGTTIVPMVVRGAWDLSPGKQEWHFVPGEFSLTVHPPIDASGWREDTVAHEAARVHATYRRWLHEPPPANRAGSFLIDGPFKRQG